MLFNCSPRRALMTAHGCAAVHNVVLERARKREPVVGADVACAACPGILARLEAGLEPPPTETPYEIKPNGKRLRFGDVRQVKPRDYSTRPRRKCEQCGTLFTQKNMRQVYCQTKCQHIASGKTRGEWHMVERKCLECDAPFKVSEGGVKKYCSDPCRSRYKHKMARAHLGAA